MEKDFNEILDSIKSLRNKITIYAPSLKKDIQLYSLNLQQQKNIIEDSTEDALTLLSFYNISYEIFNSNLVDTTVEDLNSIDRIALYLGIKNDLDGKITIENDNLDLDKIIDKNKKINYAIEPQEIKIDSIATLIRPPSLKLDYEVNRFLFDRYKDLVSDNSFSKKIVSDLYSYEVYKFIDTITLDTQVIKLQDVPVEVGSKLVDQISGKVLKEITKYINTFRELENKYLNYRGKDIEITPDIFIS